MHPTESEMHPIYETLLNLHIIPMKKVSFVYLTKETFFHGTPVHCVPAACVVARF